MNMDVAKNNNETCCPSISPLKKSTFNISSNWKIINDRRFEDTISINLSSEAPKSTSLETVVSLDTCIELERDKDEDGSCFINIKFTNGQEVSAITVVAEASIMEFYKQFGEYTTTVVAEFIDEFENNTVYFAETSIDPPTPEITIKFLKLKMKASKMWLYGIRLTLTEPKSVDDPNTFHPNVINSLLLHSTGAASRGAEVAKNMFKSFCTQENDISKIGMNSYLQNVTGMNLNSYKRSGRGMQEDDVESLLENKGCTGDFRATVDTTETKTYIDDKLKEMERRLIEKMETVESVINLKLDVILKLLSGKVEDNV